MLGFRQNTGVYGVLLIKIGPETFLKEYSVDRTINTIKQSRKTMLHFRVSHLAVTWTRAVVPCPPGDDWRNLGNAAFRSPTDNA